LGFFDNQYSLHPNSILFLIMNTISRFLCPAVLLIALNASAQQKPFPGTVKKPATVFKARTEQEWLKIQVDSLTGYKMYGRGYVNNGKETAARYIVKEFKEFKLKPIFKDGTYQQGFAFPVNTFPGEQILEIDDKKLRPGEEYVIDPSSPSFSASNLEVKKVNFAKIKDTTDWKETLATIDSTHIWYFDNFKSVCSLLQLRRDQMVAQLPRGCYLIPEENRLTWNVSRQTMAATVFYVKESLMPKKIKSVKAEVKSVFIERCSSLNISGVVPGEVKDTFLAITTHYDHLGMMGDSATFAGASDNASGVAMLLSIASYFGKFPQHYSILFVAFAGENAGLMGSEFFTWQPPVPLKNIKFLTNLGIMSDFSTGMTVVNGTQYPIEFDQMDKINKKEEFVSEITPKGQAANSDHYHFSKLGVPAFFIYSNGGKAHFHDVFDSPELLSLTNTGGANRLLIDFIKSLN